MVVCVCCCVDGCAFVFRYNPQWLCVCCVDGCVCCCVDGCAFVSGITLSGCVCGVVVLMVVRLFSGITLSGCVCGVVCGVVVLMVVRLFQV